MTFRAIAIGLLCAVVTGAYGQYVSKYVPGTWGLVRGHLPVSVFGLLIFFTIVVNPVLGLIRRSWRFQAREIALILGMILVTCGIVDAGMMRYIPRQLMTPIQQERTLAGWQEKPARDGKPAVPGILSYTPSLLLANEGKFTNTVVTTYFQGMGDQNKRMEYLKQTEKTPGSKPWRSVVAWSKGIVPAGDIPWQAWWKPLVIWTTLITLTLVGTLCLAILVHRQWADKEKIRYPLAEVASSLLRQDEHGKTSILGNRLFWLGLAVPLFIRIANGIYAWYPDSIQIPLSFDFGALSTKFPDFMKTPGAANFATPTIFPACVGLTFLLASDIGLSLGLSNIVTVGFLFLLIQFGVDLSGSDMTGGYISWQSFGSFLALTFMLIFIGRRYYWQTSVQALTGIRQPETEPTGVWSLRIFLVCVAGAISILTAIGLDWILAVLAIAVAIMAVLGCARLNAECGTFFFAPPWKIAGILMGIFGMATLGPKMIIILGMLIFILQGDLFECLMPYVTNSLKIGSDVNLKIGRMGVVFTAGLLLAIAVAVPTALWADYNNGAAVRRGGDGTIVWDTANQSLTQLTISGQLEKTMKYSAMDRVRNMIPDRTFLVAAAIGFFLLLGFSALRLRFTWWPLHPVLILTVGTGIGKFAFSFMLGWMIKVAVSRFAGVQKYTDLKPMMIGVVVGDLAGGFIFLVISWAYYAFTGVAGREVLLW
ncbi:MAG: hypothetical protein C0404_01345 [Verrucomicrobia bacterium]|nr:hypothetical protein [Verrucomicrobiota bacterium]